MKRRINVPRTILEGISKDLYGLLGKLVRAALYVIRRNAYMSRTIGMEPLKKHLRYTLTSGYVKNKKRPVTTLIIAPAERGKSTEATKFDEAGSGLLYLQDFTSYGLRELLSELSGKERGGIHHIVIPDLERISARSRNVRHQILADMRTIVEEGFIRARTYNTDLDMSESPYQCGFIICTTKEDVSDGRSIYRKGNSLPSRLVPFTYDFSNGMREDVLDFVMGEDSYMREQKESLVGRVFDVVLSDSYTMTLKMCAKILARETEKWTNSPDELIGVRALENLSTYVKSIALYNGRQKVTEDDFNEFLWLFNWMNFRYYDIDEFERRD